MAKISKDTPLSEITLRRYERPSEDLTERDIVRKLCLSLGLLQPGDSRDVIVDVLYALLEGKREKIAFTSEEVRDKVSEIRKRHSLPLAGMASSNIRRQLLRLRDLYIAEKNINKTTNLSIPPIYCSE